MVAMSGLFTILRRRRSEPRTPEHTYRSFLFTKLVMHVEEFRTELGPKWPSFADELKIRVEPSVLPPPSEVTTKMVNGAADAIVDQCKDCPDIVDRMGGLFNMVEELLPNLSLPDDWRVKQDLLTNFHRLHDWLLKDEAERSLDSESESSLSSAGGSSLSRGVSSLSGRSTSMASSGSGDPPQGFMEVPVWFATCRRPTGSLSTEAYFGTERGDALSLGIVKVSIPDTDNVAQTRQELPHLWWWDRFRPSRQSRKAVLVTKCVAMTEEFTWYHVIRHVDRLEPGKKELCVYVHGFNNRFTKAAKKMALCGYKMQADAPLILFSWPSYQSVDRYNADEGNAMWAVPHLMDFLWKLLTDCELEKVHLIGHSMGSRIILYALARIGERLFPKGAAKLGRLVLAAPDFDLGEFYLMQEHLSRTMEHVTIYSSANDQALHVSKRIHGGHPRLGEFPITAGVRPWHTPFADNIDLIDATGLDRSVIGHGYVFSHAGVLRDACEFLGSGVPARERPAVRLTTLPDGFKYYTFQGVSGTPSAIEEALDIEDPDDLDGDSEYSSTSTVH